MPLSTQIIFSTLALVGVVALIRDWWVSRRSREEPSRRQRRIVNVGFLLTLVFLALFLNYVVSQGEWGLGVFALLLLPAKFAWRKWRAHREANSKTIPTRVSL